MPNGNGVAVPTISALIPVKNEERKIRSCIEGLLKQTLRVAEIIVIDSGSTDRTLEILKEYPEVQVIEVSPEEFNHGSTRNLGVMQAKGDYCLLTVGDAHPCDETWVQKLYSGFINESVAAVCGKQVVEHHPDNNPVEWYRPVSTPELKIVYMTETEFNKLPAREKRLNCGWDDVTAMYKTKVLRDLPFRTTSYAEDALWAKDAFIKGLTLVYNPSAMVYHYHKSDPGFAFSKSFTVFYHRFKYFGDLPDRKPTDLRYKLSIIKSIIRAEGIAFSSRFYWWRYNLILKRNINFAVDKFYELLDHGESELDAFHAANFKAPPVPLKY